MSNNLQTSLINAFSLMEGVHTVTYKVGNIQSSFPARTRDSCRVQMRCSATWIQLIHWRLSTSENRCRVIRVVGVVMTLRASRYRVWFQQMQKIPPKLQTHVNTILRMTCLRNLVTFKTVPFGYRGALETKILFPCFSLFRLL